MILDAARAAASQLFTPPFRRAFFKSLGLTLLLLAALWLALRQLFETFAMPWLDALLPGLPSWAGWLGALAAVAAGLGLALALALLIAPIAAIVAGVFLDDVAEAVERESYPADPPGQAVPLLPGIWLSLKFFGVVVLANLVALALLLVPGVNLAIFFIVNAYLLGREFFEFAAMRFRSEPEAKELRRRHAGTVFLAGFVIAAFLAVPLLNLLTPLFAAAMMVHLHKMISAREETAPARASAG
ncbi:sulfate transporter family protein [Chelativorans intermedius]|uniref:Sulfate transporter family protein n=1 Tax=Chelativorans intermedius TaxID=515947 RepID=A0ABV6DCM7_9HYPH|nr:sulfate transporter family protein [Chelativorans intermedius]MCT8999091.1 sulfate transporter family protein [Chelativorans intermedius]